MQAILTEEEYNLSRQTDYNFKVLYNVIQKFRESLITTFKCNKECERCMFKNSTFDGKTCLAGFYLPGVEEQMLLDQEKLNQDVQAPMKNYDSVATPDPTK